jgi:hypothetical protein
MAGISLATAQAQLDLWLAADIAVAAGQAYEVAYDGRSKKLTRVDAAEIRNRIDYWDRKVRQLSGTAAGRRVRYVVPE